MDNKPTSLDGETWKPVPSLPGIWASSIGRIWTEPYLAQSTRDKQPTQLRPAKVISGELGIHGYRSIKLKRDGKQKKHLVHRLVCEAFHGAPPFDGATVDHIDGCRTNNRVENLEWVSRSENSKRQNAAGRGAPKGELHPIAKLSDYQAASIFRLTSEGWSAKDIAKLFGVSESLVYMIRQGKKRAYAHPDAPKAA